MRHIKFLLFSFFMLAPLCSSASEVECMDRPECWPDGSAMRTGLELRQRTQAVEELLARKHAELVALASPGNRDGSPDRLRSALIAQQAGWLRYRREECELVGALTGADSAWTSAYATRCEANHAEQRLRRLQSAIRCIERIPSGQRTFQQGRCMQQLAPLTNR